MLPKVTIIMATYNRGHFIVESLLSIQNQVYTDWECLIIDDGGTDETDKIITPILENDVRFQYLKRPDNYNKGLSGCRNYGLDTAKGEFIIFFDDDDIAHPQNLELCVLELQDVGISFCRYIRDVFFESFDYVFDYSKTYTSFYIDKKDVERMLKNELQFNSCAIMWKRECFEKNRFAENVLYSEDWELYSRIVSSGYRGISIDKPLFFGRKHANSMTGEFYRNDPLRRESFTVAILLVVQSLKEKQLLTYSLKRYFIATAIEFKEYNLYKKILNILELSKFEKLKWQFFYTVLPLRLEVYKIKKAITKRFNQ